MVKYCRVGRLAASSALALSLSGLCFATSASEVTKGKVDQGEVLSYAAAKAMALPMSEVRPSGLRRAMAAPATGLGEPGSSPGSPGTGEAAGRGDRLPTSKHTGDPVIAPKEYGTLLHPFTTNRVRTRAGSRSTVQVQYPFSAAGRLFFKVGPSTSWCSAALVKPGVVITAAHCVADFGARRFYSGFEFIPAYDNGAAPFGRWKSRSAYILTSYYDGSDSCAVSGIVCANDVAVIVLKPQKRRLPGVTTGWLGYGWNGYGYGAGISQIDQLGYPGGLDNGNLMQRNGSYGYIDASLSSNQVIGSLMDGGSSGGPWVVNLGIAPRLTGTSFGFEASRNIIVGVTSWGYVDAAPKELGASPFTSGNAKLLVDAACADYPANC